jgi:hypothetical protein
LKRQIRLCQEYVADAAAAREGAAADDYAEFLVSLAKGPATPLGAAGLGTTSDLFRRVHMLLQTSSRGSRSGSRSPSWLTAGALLTAAVVASGIGVRAEPPDNQADKPLVRKIVTSGDVRVFDDLLLDQDVILLVKDEEPQGDEPKKSDKGRVNVQHLDGKIVITITGDAKSADVKQLVEKALAEARKRGDGARQTDNEGKARAERAAAEAARKLAEGARKADSDARSAAQKAAEAGRKAAEEARRAAAGARAQAARAAEEARRQVEQEKRQVEDRKEQVEKTQKERVRAIQPMVAAAGAMRLGVRLDRPSAAMADQLNLGEDRGLVIVDVVDGSSAEKAGFKANDILVEFAGKSVSSNAGEFTRQIRELKSDEAVDAVVLRKGRKERIRGIKLAEARSGAVQVNPADVMRGFKDGKFEIQLDKIPGLDPKLFKDGKIDLKFDGILGFDPKDFKFDIQLDGIDGKKIADEIKKKIEMQVGPEHKEKLKELHKQLELKLEPLKKERLDDLKKEIELKLEPLKGERLDDLKKELELKLEPLKKDLEMRIAPLKELQEINVDDLKKKIKARAEGSDSPGTGQKSESSSNSVSVTVNNGDFKAVQKQDNLEITVLGAVQGEKVNVREIKIYADGEKGTYKSIDQVPAKHRDKVKKLISNRDDSPVRFRFDRDNK